MKEKIVLRQEFWEKSYKRGENFIFYPNEELVKFLNRFVRKQINLKEFVDIIKREKEGKIRVLDFGCGIGGQSILLEKFGIEAYGIDISSEAINIAKQNSVINGYPELQKRLLVYNGSQIPFEDNFFDVVISLGVIDSITFGLAKKLIKEIDRVTRYLVFITLISGDNDEFYREFDGEEVVKKNHEKGTIQTYYNWTKILRLIQKTNLNVKWARLMTEEGINHRYKHGRYYIILEKAKS